MKKILLLLMLVTAGMIEKSSAQYDASYFQLSKTEQLFTANNAQWLRHKFYIVLSKGNRIGIQLSNKNELENIMNLDSLLQEMYKNILLINDSMKNELTNKRIDFFWSTTGISKMRFQEFQPRGSSYGFQNKELVALKIEQDTINIIGYYSSKPKWASTKSGIAVSEPFRITVLINNISELPQYLNGSINLVMQQLKSDWDQYKKWTPKKNWDMKLFAVYDINDPKRNSKFQSQSISDAKFHIDPLVQVTLQNVRDLFAPSCGVGFDLYRFDYYSREKHFQLIWEPFFFFEKNSSNKKTLQRNDFVTFQYKDIREVKPAKEKTAIRYYQQFSLSYLVHRDGDYLEKNTFRTGFPGFQYRNLTLAPEFIFHDFFKQFTPALKLSLYFE